MSPADRSALLLLIAGFSVWSLAFVLLYALQALGCAYGWPYHRAILVAVYGFTLLPLAWLALPSPHKTASRAAGGPVGALSVAALWANRAALASGVIVFLPVTFASVCV